MVAVPVFLFWDETIKDGFAAVIREKIKTKIFQDFVELGLEFHFAIFIIDKSGDSLIQKRKFSKFDVDSSEWNLESGIVPVNSSIREPKQPSWINQAISARCVESTSKN
jgi:hypothetical protein